MPELDTSNTRAQERTSTTYHWLCNLLQVVIWVSNFRHYILNTLHSKALLSCWTPLCERGDWRVWDVSCLSMRWEPWFGGKGGVFAGCQKFVNSLPALHRHLQCQSTCHFLMGEVVISNFNFAIRSKPVCVCVWVCVHLQVCVCVSKLKAAGLCVTAQAFDV